MSNITHNEIAGMYRKKLSSLFGHNILEYDIVEAMDKRIKKFWDRKIYRFAFIFKADERNVILKEMNDDIIKNISILLKMRGNI